MARVWMALVVIVGLAPWASAQADEHAEKVDAIFEYFQQPGSPGVVVTAMHEGEIVLDKAYGLAQLEYNIATTPDTIFHVASVSKQFAAFSVVLLAHEGKLSLDDDIRDHLPGFPDLGHRVTIRHLIYHTSGIRDQWSLLTMAGWRFEDVITRDDIMKLLHEQRELNFRPGDAHLYSNAGYTLIGEIVAEVSGMSLKEFTTKHIFEPLGMSNTHFHDDHRHIVPNRAYSYGSIGEGKHEKIVLSYANVGATSLFTTGADLMKWQQNFVTGKVGGEEAVATMLGKGSLNDGREIRYGFGLTHSAHRGLRTISHGGADAGFRSYLVRFPEQDFSVAVLSNLAQASPTELAFKVAEVYIGEAMKGPTEEAANPSVEVAKEVLESYEGSYMNADTNEVYRLSERDGNLRLTRGAGGARLVLQPRDATHFASAGGATLEIEMNEENLPTAIHVTMANAVQRTYLPTTRPKRNDIEYADYVGRYFSPELDAFTDVSEGEKGLVIERRKEGPSNASPLFTDGFSWEGESIRFERGADGSVTGFRTNLGRILNLRYVRVELPTDL